MGRKILIAEDEAMLAYDLVETVEAAGYRVEGPHPGVSEAMLAFQLEKPDLAILDVELGDGNVFTFARTLTDEDVPIIFHTGNVSHQEIVDRFPDAIVRLKPCPPTSMLEAVDEALEPQ